MFQVGTCNLEKIKRDDCVSKIELDISEQTSALNKYTENVEENLSPLRAQHCLGKHSNTSSWAMYKIGNESFYKINVTDASNKTNRNIVCSV